MIGAEKSVVGLYVDKSCPEHWIVRDHQGRFWMMQPGDNAWERRLPYWPTDATELEPIPGHYKYMLGLPTSEFHRKTPTAQKASLDASARQATIMGNSGYGYGGFYGGTTGSLESSGMRKQMTAGLKSNQLDAVTMLEEKTAEIRKKMTLNYQTEF